MNRLTDNDKNFGPFTLARWKHWFATYIESGDDENPECKLMFIGFGWALRIHIPQIISPNKEKKMALLWDAETVQRMGRNWYYDIDERQFGFSLTAQNGNGYDFLSIYYGRQTHDSSTDKTWSKSLPWKQWDHVRHSIYTPSGEHFYTEIKRDWEGWSKAEEACPKSYFGFEDYDGEMIVATCMVEEREWHRGEGWFTWLKWFWPAKIRRSLDLKFSAEVGPEKGSWKGGTIGHGIEMHSSETPRQAFERYCSKEHDARHGRKFQIKFVGPCSAPGQNLATA